MKTLAALDPSFRNTGVIIIDVAESKDKVVDAAIFRTIALDKKEKKGIYVADYDFQQCQDLSWNLRNYLMSKKVGGLAVELPPGGTKSARAARCFGLMTGLLAALVRDMNLPIDSIPPKIVKRIVKPGATKDEMVAWAREKYPKAVDWNKMETGGAKIEMEHLADALAVFEASRNGNVYKYLALQTRED